MLFQPKYYGGNYDNMIETLLGCKRTGCTFLVGGRNMDGVFKVGNIILNLPKHLALDFKVT